MGHDPGVIPKHRSGITSGVCQSDLYLEIHACNPAAQNPRRSGFGDPPGGDKSFCCQQTMQRVEITTMHAAENAEEETLIKDVYTYLTRKSYPADCLGNMKRIIRRKALKLQVTENGELYYKYNQKGQVRTQYMYNIYACTYHINVLIKNLPTRHAVYCRSICSMMCDSFLIL